jgi:hypothetical protein
MGVSMLDVGVFSSHQTYYIDLQRPEDDGGRKDLWTCSVIVEMMRMSRR